MTHKDYMVKSIINDGMFRAYVVDATNLVQEAQTRHDTWSASSAALGRSLVGTLLLASSVLKGEEKMTVRIQGDGPVGGIVVDGNANGTVKGYLQDPHVHLPLNSKGKIDVAGAVGTTGTLSVTKDLLVGEPFTGQVELVSGELGEDFTYYLAQSEQIPSAVGLSVFVNPDNSIEVAGGFLIQVLPGASDEAITDLETKLSHLPLISQLLQEHKAPEDILYQLFEQDTVKIEKNGIAFMKFRALDMIDELNRYNQIKLNVVGKANLNNWGGQITPQLFIESYELVDSLFEF